MGKTAKSLGIDRMSVADRMHLIEEIWDSILDEADDLDLPQCHRDELDRRLAARQANPQAGSSWEDVRARLINSSEESR